MTFKFIRRHSTGTIKWRGGSGGQGGWWGWDERGQFTGENSACTIKLTELSNIKFLMRSFKYIII